MKYVSIAFFFSMSFFPLNGLAQGFSYELQRKIEVQKCDPKIFSCKELFTRQGPMTIPVRILRTGEAEGTIWEDFVVESVHFQYQYSTGSSEDKTQLFLKMTYEPPKSRRKHVQILNHWFKYGTNGKFVAPPLEIPLADGFLRVHAEFGKL